MSDSRGATPTSWVTELADPSGPGTQTSTAEGIAAEPAGRYTLLKELSRGGQGIVHLAYDTQLGRQIAFKVLLPAHIASEPGSYSPAEARFVREARITAQLDHPGIAPLHEVGLRADGSLYAIQKLVRGRTLAEALEKCSSLKDRLQLVPALLGAAQAVAFAHGRGVIHRDLK